LVICGIVQDERYFHERVQPHIDQDRVQYLGSVGPDQRAVVLGSALALLHPIGFDEPFGLSVVESMACGTPVVAYRRGSMPEIIDDGVTGFLVDDAAQAADAVRSVPALDRATCRAVAERRFGVDRMVQDYVAVYDQILRGGGG
jgi:glycosyltransferase involved in cell wall biosynthesis